MQPQWRKNVLFVAVSTAVFNAVIVSGILFMVSAGNASIQAHIPMLVTALVGVAGGVNTVLGMICKELLTEPPPPTVPASTVREILDKLGK